MNNPDSIRLYIHCPPGLAQPAVVRTLENPYYVDKWRELWG